VRVTRDRDHPIAVGLTRAAAFTFGASFVAVACGSEVIVPSGPDVGQGGATASAISTAAGVTGSRIPIGTFSLR
jgi:hypothetical protein